jgi:hypothetical protein
MMSRPLAVRPIGAWLVLAALLGACGSSSAATTAPSASLATPEPTPVPTPTQLTAFPDGFPTSFTDKRPTTLPPLSTVADGLRGHLDGTLLADDGLSARYTSTWIESRVPAARMSCGGVNYANVFTVADPTVTSQVTFPGWGTGTFVATKRIVVYPSSRDGSSPPLCEDQGGGSFTIRFDSGSTPGILSGTWTETFEGSVTLELPGQGSPAPSA